MAKKRNIGDRFRNWVQKWFQTILLAVIVSVSIAAVISFNHIETIIKQIPDMKDALIRIEEHTNQLNDMNTTLARVEERTKDIEGMKSGVDKLLGKAGVAEITPTSGGILTTKNVEIDVPPNSVSEPILFRVDKISVSGLPASLPSNDYEYSDGFMWSTQGVNLGNNASVAWVLGPNTDCVSTKILYWNSDTKAWQEVPPEKCSTAIALIIFSAKDGGYYVLAKEKSL